MNNEQCNYVQIATPLATKRRKMQKALATTTVTGLSARRNDFPMISLPPSPQAKYFGLCRLSLHTSRLILVFVCLGNLSLVAMAGATPSPRAGDG